MDRRTTEIPHVELKSNFDGSFIFYRAFYKQPLAVYLCVLLHDIHINTYESHKKCHKVFLRDFYVNFPHEQ
jgi:hypothetical protein